MSTFQRIERYAGIVLLALIVVGCAVVLMPFITAIMWAAILCFSSWPMYRWFERKFHGQRSWAAAVMTTLIALVVVIPFMVVGFTFAENVAHFAERINNYRSEGVPAPPAWVQHIPLIGDYLNSYLTSLSMDTDKAMLALKEGLNRSMGWILRRGIDLGHGILQLALSVLIAFFFYRDGEEVVARVAEGVKRIAGDRSQRMLSVVGGTIKGVVYGVLATALGQGVVAAIGFYIVGLPSPILLGLLTFFSSLIPFAPLLVWVPVTLALFLTHHPWLGIFIAVWGLFWVNLMDNLVRPYLISKGGELPFVPVLLGVLGGIMGFGFIGIFLGPILLAIGYGLLLEFTLSRKPSRDTSADA